MRKGRGKICLGVGIVSVLASVPWFLGVFFTKEPFVGFRYNYLIGVANVRGWCGDSDGAQQLGGNAVRARWKRTIVEYGPLSQHEEGVLRMRLEGPRAKINYSIGGGEAGWPRFKNTGRSRIELPKSEIDDFFKLIEEVKRELSLADELDSDFEAAAWDWIQYKRRSDGYVFTVQIDRIHEGGEALVEELLSELPLEGLREELREETDTSGL